MHSDLNAFDENEIAELSVSEVSDVSGASLNAVMVIINSIAQIYRIVQA